MQRFRARQGEALNGLGQCAFLLPVSQIEPIYQGYLLVLSTDTETLKIVLPIQHHSCTLWWASFWHKGVHRLDWEEKCVHDYRTMGSQQWEAHPNNTISQKREWPSLSGPWGRHQREGEVCILFWSWEASSGSYWFPGLPGLWPWFTLTIVSLASSFTSLFLFTFSQVMFPTSFQLPNLTSSLWKPNTWHLYLRFQWLLLCPALPQQMAVSPLLGLWP